MKTIAVMNVKGGVGKTMTACNMAHILADTYRQRVLLIDADPQGNASDFFGVRPTSFEASLTDLLTDRLPDYESIIHNTSYEGVDVIPADSSLFSVDLHPIEDSAFSARVAIKELCDRMAAEQRYNIVIIDCPPSFTVSAIAALRAADSVIVPVKLDAFSVDGMEFLLDQIAAVSQINGKAQLEGVLVTLWHNCCSNVQAENQLRARGVRIFETHIRRSDKADESTWYRSPICEYSKYSSTARDMRDFCAEFVKTGGLKNGEV